MNHFTGFMNDYRYHNGPTDESAVKCRLVCEQLPGQPMHTYVELIQDVEPYVELLFDYGDEY